MGIAALIIGIVAVIVGFIPVCGIIALLPAIVGLILGIVEVSKKSKANQPKGLGLAGIILNAVAIIVIVVWSALFAKAAQKEMQKGFDEAQKRVEEGVPPPASEPKEPAGEPESEDK